MSRFVDLLSFCIWCRSLISFVYFLCIHWMYNNVDIFHSDSALMSYMYHFSPMTVYVPIYPCKLSNYSCPLQGESDHARRSFSTAGPVLYRSLNAIPELSSLAFTDRCPVAFFIGSPTIFLLHKPIRTIPSLLFFLANSQMAHFDLEEFGFHHINRLFL